MHSRRARPTLRLLVEDLTDGWQSPQPQRLLADGAYGELHPLSELPHPIIAKAAASFGSDGTDNFVGPIASSTNLRLFEIKSGQWRGGVWEDPATGVRWLVVAGLAKGDHEDHDDFYQRIQRENKGDVTKWLPTPDDQRLLKQETAARLLAEWELDVQEQVLNALREVQSGGSIRYEVMHPLPDKGPLATVTLEVVAVREPDYEADEIGVEISPAPMYATADLPWQLTIRILISLSPPVQGWDRYQNTFSNIVEPDAWSTRVTQLEISVANRELVKSEPGRYSHYAPDEDLVKSTIEGRAVRALCGLFFVPTQDHGKLPVCPDCEQLYNTLPT